MKQRNIVYTKEQLAGLLLAGLVSGLLSFFCANFLPIFLTGLFIIPGFLFSAAIALFGHKVFGIKYATKSVIAFVGLSTIGYFIAINIYWSLSGNTLTYGIGQAGSLLAGSLAGSFLLLVGYSIAFRLSFTSFIILTFWGVLLSLAFLPAISLDPSTDGTFFNLQLAGGFMIWQGGMALGLGLVTLRKMQNVFIAGLIILVLGLTLIAAFKIDRFNAFTQENMTKNDYQQEVNGIVSSDFILVSSNLENRGIDSGIWLTDDYTTHLTFDQAISLMESNASRKGYPTPVNAQCFGGIEYQSAYGMLDICETKTRDKNGVTTFEIILNNFSKNPPQITPAFQCVGDCKK